MHPLIRTLIFTILVPGTVTVLIPYTLLPPGTPLAARGWRWTGLAPIALGAALYAWCAWHFAMTGRGTPAPIDPPRVLVARGPYRIVRNPMYLAVEQVLVGEAILFPVLTTYPLWVGAVFHLFVVIYEEPTLRKKFGASYEDYCRTVPRWIPRLRASVPKPTAQSP